MIRSTAWPLSQHGTDLITQQGGGDQRNHQHDGDADDTVEQHRAKRSVFLYANRQHSRDTAQLTEADVDRDGDDQPDGETEKVHG